MVFRVQVFGLLVLGFVFLDFQVLRLRWLTS